MQPVVDPSLRLDRDERRPASRRSVARTLQTPNAKFEGVPLADPVLPDAPKRRVKAERQAQSEADAHAPEVVSDMSAQADPDRGPGLREAV